ncbi:MAG TPA: PorV/PorQ family protein [Ignavibacteriales bacterium]|nr:PorV/PorQ family protein [Ignavibacteriales bacterium]
MKNIKISLVLILLVLAAAQSVYAGGGNRNGTAGAAQLLIPVGTRGIAMGGSTLTNAVGPEAIYWNPANLSRAANTTNVMLSQMNYIADIGVSYGAVSTNIEGFGALGLSIKGLSMGEIDNTTVENPDGTGQTFTPQFMTLGVTYSRMLSDRIAVGLTANYISEKLDRVSATGFAFNVGISYQNLGNINGLSFAVVMKNIGPQMQYDGSGLLVQATASGLNRGQQLYTMTSAPFELPSTLELGMGYKYDINSENALQLSGAFQNSNFYGDEYKLGAEYGFNNLFFVRGGYSYVSDINRNDVTFGPTAGAGINYQSDGFDFKFDYAYRQTKFFSANHVFSIAFGF